MLNERRLPTLAQARNTLLTVSKDFHDEVIEVGPKIMFDGLSKLDTSQDVYTLRPTAQKQMCAKLGVPFQYLDKCGVDLQSRNMNYWLEGLRGKKLFLRMDRGEIRAIFTTKYKPIDNIEIVNRLLELNVPETKVDFILHTDVMALSIPQPKHTFSLGRGDDFQPGMSVLNSETGYRSFSVEAFVLRLVCTNGLIKQVPAAFARVRHIISNFWKRYSLAQAMQDVLTSAQDIKIDLTIAQQTVYEDPIEVFQKINKRFQITSQENDAALWGYTQDPGKSLYHLINGLTRGAQYPGLAGESQYRLEYIAGMCTGLARNHNPII